jgi:hypothetical protein
MSQGRRAAIQKLTQAEMLNPALNAKFERLMLSFSSAIEPHMHANFGQLL